MVGRIFAAAFLIGVVLNFAWEMAQSPLYAPMGTFWEATWRCFVASVGDGVIVIVALAGTAVVGQRAWVVNAPPRWYASVAIAALLFAVAVESWGLSTGQWAYTDRMPRVPGTRLGIVPLAQMMVLVPLSLWLARRWRAFSVGVEAGDIRRSTSPRAR
jgi:hypothetical protein